MNNTYVFNEFWLNITVQVEKNTQNTYLQLSRAPCSNSARVTYWHWTDEPVFFINTLLTMLKIRSTKGLEDTAVLYLRKSWFGPSKFFICDRG